MTEERRGEVTHARVRRTTLDFLRYVYPRAKDDPERIDRAACVAALVVDPTLECWDLDCDGAYATVRDGVGKTYLECVRCGMANLIVERVDTAVSK